MRQTYDKLKITDDSLRFAVTNPLWDKSNDEPILELLDELYPQFFHELVDELWNGLSLELWKWICKK